MTSDELRDRAFAKPHCPWCFVRWVSSLGLSADDMRLLVETARRLST